MTVMRSAMRLARLLLVLLLLFPASGWARAGMGSSFGSRGSRTYAPPPATSLAPSPAPIQRSFTPREQPQPAPMMAAPLVAPRRHSPFMSGVLGGLLGAGLLGVLFGHGLFGGLNGITSAIGFFIQLILLVLLVRFLLQMFLPARPQPDRAPLLARAPPAASAGPPLALQRSDFDMFETVLRDVQAAWTAKDQTRMRQLATPEMVEMFGEQLAALSRSGHRNSVTDIKLEKGDLSEAWTENGRDYATVAMQFSMVDVTRDTRGYVVDGSPDEHVVVTELWTFMRQPPGGTWLLSAIQQGR